jgi:hypothetical protein
MQSLVQKCQEKLFDYNRGIKASYKVEETNEFMIITDEMIIAVDENKSLVSCAFEATTKPDLVAKLTLLLAEIEDIKQVAVMESYVFENDHLVVGEQAFEIARRRLGNEVINEFVKKQVYNDIIKTEKCGEC